MCADKQEPAAVITLVHGTFARGADWATHGSSFCRKLTDNIGSEVEFEQFQWSGANNIKDRKKAADRLASFLRKQRARYPEALQLVIGHSHGGSVVAYLLRGHPLLASTIAGAAFLATPFVYARPREDWPLIAAVTAVAFLLCFCAIVTTALLYGALIMTYEARNPVVGGSLFASAIILWVIIVIVVRRAARSNRMAQRHNIDQLAEYISTARLPKGKYFFMKGTGDEAASALGAAQFASWLFSTIVSIAVEPVFRARKHPAFSFASDTAPFAGISAGIIAALVLNQHESLAEISLMSFISGALKIIRGVSAQGWMSGLVVLSWVCIVLLAFAFSALWVICCLVCWIAHMSFGRASLRTALYVDLAIEPVPTGAHVIVHTPWVGPRSAKALSHSSPYQDPYAIGELSEWLNNVLGAGRAQNSSAGELG